MPIKLSDQSRETIFGLWVVWFGSGLAAFGLRAFGLIAQTPRLWVLAFVIWMWGIAKLYAADQGRQRKDNLARRARKRKENEELGNAQRQFPIGT